MDRQPFTNDSFVRATHFDEGLGATTTGLTHVVGPSTYLMISFLSNSSILGETFSRSENGTLLNFVPLEVHLGQHANAT